jgi:uncharacterized protein YndB with AHSA1/START domain
MCNYLVSHGEGVIMEQMTVERSIWIGAPREQVWRAIIDPEQLAQWLLPPILGAQMKRDDNGQIYVGMGGMDVPVALFEAVDPPKQVAIRGLPDKLITATFTLREERAGTHVTVTMNGLGAMPEDAGRDRVGPSSAGWEKGLQNLKAHVDGAELPFPEGYVAALFGYRREGKKTFSVERSIWLAAPRERVWRAITDPKLIQQWYSPATPWRLTELRAGGKLSTYDAETGADVFVQMIEVVDPPRQLVVRSVAQPPATSQVTTYTLEEENGGTRLTLTNSGYELEPQDTRQQNMEQNAFGFGMVLENLQAHLDGRDLPYPWGF